MTLTLPFKSGSFAVYQVESRERKLKLAVRVLDQFTGAPVPVPVRVSLSQKTPGGAFVEQIPVRNHTGDFCFEEIEDGNYFLKIEPDPVLEQYFLHPEPNQPWIDGFLRDVVIPHPGGPGIEVILTPRPGYPFPPGTTLARGQVVDNAKQGVNCAVVKATYVEAQPTLGDPDASASVTAETRTDGKGYFTLFFRSLHVTPSNAQLVATEGGRQGNGVVALQERESVNVPTLKIQ
jgi:hypothetical protein